MHGVSLQTPPRSDLFAEFHGLSGSSSVTQKMMDSTPVTVALPNANMTPAAPAMFMPSPYMFPAPWFPPPYGNPQGGFPATPHFTPSRHSHVEKHDLPSSDPPEDAFLEPYPEISVFFNRLATDNPRRKLANFIEIFENHDYYTVDDIANLTLERFTADPFNMTPGNAEFLLKEIGKEMKRINQIRRRECKRRRY
jgi:hypothetical protein